MCETLFSLLVPPSANEDYHPFTASLTFESDDEILCVGDVETIDDAISEETEAFQMCLIPDSVYVTIGELERTTVYIEDDESVFCVLLFV